MNFTPPPVRSASRLTSASPTDQPPPCCRICAASGASTYKDHRKGKRKENHTGPSQCIGRILCAPLGRQRPRNFRYVQITCRTTAFFVLALLTNAKESSPTTLKHQIASLFWERRYWYGVLSPVSRCAPIVSMLKLTMKQDMPFDATQLAPLGQTWPRSYRSSLRWRKM